MDVVAVATVVAAVVGVVPAVQAGRGWWRRGPGRRRDIQRAAERLSLGLPLDYVSEMLGAPVRTRTATKPAEVEKWIEREAWHREQADAMPPEAGTDARRSEEESADYYRALIAAHPSGPSYTEHLYATSWSFVQAIDKGDGVVHRFAVSSRHKRFRPTFRLPWSNVLPPLVRLRKTKFAEFPGATGVAWRTVQIGGYFEETYGARPGGYRYVQCSVGPITWTENGLEMIPALIASSSVNAMEVEFDPANENAVHRAFRQSISIATYGESEHPLTDDPFPLGPDDWAFVGRLRLEGAPPTALHRLLERRKHRKSMAEALAHVQPRSHPSAPP